MLPLGHSSLRTTRVKRASLGTVALHWLPQKGLRLQCPRGTLVLCPRKIRPLNNYTRASHRKTLYILALSPPVTQALRVLIALDTQDLDRLGALLLSSPELWATLSDYHHLCSTPLKSIFSLFAK